MAGDRIKTFQYRLINVPLISPFAFATYKLTELPYAWCRIETSSGLVGFGEAPTYWDPTGETQFAAVGAFRLWEPLVKKTDPAAWRGLLGSICSLSRGAYSARCAIETALLDLSSQACGVPGYRLLGGDASPLPINAILPLSEESPEELADKAVSKFHDGYETFKIKSNSRSAQRDLELVRRIKENTGGEATVFVDANQSWAQGPSPLTRIRALADVGVDWIEQPLAAHDVIGYRRMVASSPVPIMLDESITDTASLAQWLGADAVGFLNIKLAKAGGPLSALDQAMMSDAFHVRYSIGSMIESGLGMLANYHVAASCAPLTCGFDAYSLVDDGLSIGFRFEGGRLSRDPDRDGMAGLGYDYTEVQAMFEKGTEL